VSTIDNLERENLAAKLALLEILPNVEIRHCLFHLSQSVFRKIASDGMIQLYRNDLEFKKAIRSLPSLSFLNLDQVLNGFEAIRVQAPPEAVPFYEYFKKFTLPQKVYPTKI
jgi:hypothetical protein